MRADGRSHPVMTCRHCRVRRVWRSRGLCNPCYDDPGIRNLYPPIPYALAGRAGGLENGGKPRGVQRRGR